MKTLRRGVAGLLAAFAVVAMVFGALSLGMLEASSYLEPTTSSRITQPPPNLTPITGTNPTLELLTSQEMYPATPTLCPQPAGWESYIVKTGDDLKELAESRGYSLEQILAGNCLIIAMTIPDVMIYLPPAMVFAGTEGTPATATPVCQPPTGWTSYIVKRGDTLSRISNMYRVTVSHLKEVNCLLSDTILPGWAIWVPNVATSTMTASPTLTVKPTDWNTPTQTITHTSTITQTATTPSTATVTRTATITNTFTNPPTATHTPTPTNTPTEIPSPTFTPTEIPTPINN